ncbi:MAG: sugar transporter [Muribaculaceae bacterium]|nr:sugar transporter [Muribaculaceae bacterium]
MPEASRTKKSIHNSVVALSYYAITLILSFFSRKIFLEYLGTDILGLNTTAQNLLQFLNLAELGIGVAVGFSLYKPLYEEDNDTVNEIVALQGKIYKRIGIIIIIGAVLLMGFFPFIFKKITLPLWYAYASFGAFLISSLLGYFLNYKQILLTASQKDYKINYSYRTILILKTIAQIIAVYFLPFPYIWWIVLEVVFSIIASVVLHIVTIREFPNLQNVKIPFKELRKKYSSLVTKIKQLFFHKIGGFALTQTSPLIIYAFIDLNVVALYGNYMVVINGIQMMMASMFNSMGAGVGNLVAEGDEQKIRNVFRELFSLRFVITATLCAGVIYFTPAFISLWIGKEYLLPFSTLLLLTTLLFIGLSRYTVEAFVTAYGLYSDIWAPVIEASINIGLSIILGSVMGLNGIILGVVISQILVIVMWKPFYLFKKSIKGFLKNYIIIYTTHIISGIGIGVLVWLIFKSYINNASTSCVSFIVNGIFVILPYTIILTALLCLFSQGMRLSLVRIKNLILKTN